jgi:phage major head subunit gpT-like protein
MPVPARSEDFPDVLDPRFQRIFHDAYGDVPDMLPQFFEFIPSNGRDNIRFSQIGAFGDWPQFTGNVVYQDFAQGYDTIATYLEFASGFQIRRTLYEDEQFNIIDDLPRTLGDAAGRTRQRHGARIFNNAFSNDTFFYNNSEGVPLCSNSHTTTTANVSTASGFDNLTTASLSATALAAARVQMMGFRDDAANFIPLSPDTILIRPDLYDVAFEIVASAGKPDTANNNRNVHEGAYRVIEWIYLSDVRNWWLMDSRLMKQSVYWIDRIGKEFAMAEDLDTIIGKWRGRMRYANLQRDWRFVLGAQVS